MAPDLEAAPDVLGRIAALDAALSQRDQVIAELRKNADAGALIIAEQAEALVRARHSMEQLILRVQALEKAIAAITSNRVSQATEIDAQGQEYIPGILATEQEAQRIAQAAAEAAAALAAADKPKVDGRSVSKHARGGSLKALDQAQLKEVVVVRDLPPEQRCDAQGRPLVAVGEATVSVTLAYEPGAYVRRVEKAITYAPTDEPGANPVQAGPAPRVIPAGQVHESLLIQLFVMTFADHLPVYRQEKIALRAGVPLTRGTLARWLNRFCQYLEPVCDAIADQILDQPIVHIDDTTYRLIFPVDEDRKRSGQSHLGRMWAFATTEAVWFLYTDTREGRHLQSLLSDFDGGLVGDGYSGHKKTLERALIIAIYCWAHVLRKFRDCADTQYAPGIVVRIRQLYVIEDEIHQLPPEQRLIQRQQRSAPLVDELDRRIDALIPLTTPKQDLGAACRYTQHLRQGLREFLHNPAIPLDNNTCERAMRPVAISRKNRLFAISEIGAQAAAVGFTLSECCRRAGIDPHAYLGDIIPRLLAGRRDYAALTPAAWASARKPAGEPATRA